MKYKVDYKLDFGAMHVVYEVSGVVELINKIINDVYEYIREYNTDTKIKVESFRELTEEEYIQEEKVDREIDKREEMKHDNKPV